MIRVCKPASCLTAMYGCLRQHQHWAPVVTATLSQTRPKVALGVNKHWFASGEESSPVQRAACRRRGRHTAGALEGRLLSSHLQLGPTLRGCLQDHLQRATEVSRILEGRLRAEGRGEMRAHIAALEAERCELRADLQAMAAHMADWR